MKKYNMMMLPILFLMMMVLIYFLFIFDYNQKKVLIELPSKRKETLETIIINLTDRNSNDNSVIFQDKTIIITKKAKYKLTGSWDGSIIVKGTGKKELILENSIINATTDAAIHILSSEKVKVKMAQNTMNTITAPNSPAIESEVPLEIKGSGILHVTSQKKAIYTKNASLTINGGNIQIDSEEEGIYTGGLKGSSFHMHSGTLSINSKLEGITANKNIELDGGTITIFSQDKALDCDNKLQIQNANIIAIGNQNIQEVEEEKASYLDIKYTGTKAQYALLQDQKIITTFQVDQDFNYIWISNKSLNKKKYQLATIERVESTDNENKNRQFIIKDIIKETLKAK